MSGFVLSLRAQADLDDIWTYTAATWDDDQAERYVREIWLAIRMLAADPRKARACDDIRAGYRRYAVGSHVLFIRQVDADIDVVRILHGRMDFQRYL